MTCAITAAVITVVASAASMYMQQRNQAAAQKKAKLEAERRALQKNPENPDWTSESFGKMSTVIDESPRELL